MAANEKNRIIEEVTNDYLDGLDIEFPPSAETIEHDILTNVNDKFDLVKATTGIKWGRLNALTNNQISNIMLRLYNIINIKFAGDLSDDANAVLAIYKDSGKNEGLYVRNEREFSNIARSLNPELSSKDAQEVIALLRDKAPYKTPCNDKDLVAVNNGIFDYKTKKLMPFDPEFIFTAKSDVNYNPFAQNIVIHNEKDGTDWDVESWIDELTDDEGIRKLLWQIIGAVVRPNVPWNKSAWFYSTKGNNGKGTFCELLRNIVGENAHASLTLDEMSKDFMLAQLIGKTAIITDENDVGTYIDKAANFKAIVTGDVILINSKYKQPIAYRFKGLTVECVNEMPKAKDKSGSFYRRQMFIPFDKCFTGVERKYIKDVYLKNEEVLEYVLYKVLNTDYYEFDVPQACEDALDEYREYNDPIAQFWSEIRDEVTWNLLPFKFLYELYKKWFSENNPAGSLQGKQTFIYDIRETIDKDDEWTTTQKKSKVRTQNYMDAEEPLAYDYDLKEWQNFARKEKYEGAVRLNPNNSPVPITLCN